MTAARDVIAECFRSDEEPMMYSAPEANADRIIAALKAAPDPVRQELAVMLNPWRPIETASDKIDHLRTVNADLLEALKNALERIPNEHDFNHTPSDDVVREKARAAIARATGGIDLSTEGKR